MGSVVILIFKMRKLRQEQLTSPRDCKYFIKYYYLFNILLNIYIFGYSNDCLFSFLFVLLIEDALGSGLGENRIGSHVSYVALKVREP